MLPARVLRVLEALLKLDEKVRGKLPPPADQWVHKVRREAWLCSDKDAAALLAAGYTEDQIFELTLVAATDEAATRFTRSLELLGK